MIQKIKKGNHYCNWWQRRYRLAANKSTIEIKVHESWWFPKINEDSEDVNKLPGFSIGDHRNDGVRLGWVPNFDMYPFVKIYLYTTVDGIDSKTNLFVGHLLPNDYIYLEKDGSKYYVLDYNDNPVANFEHPNSHMLSYYTNFYAGGDNVAAHDMQCESVIV